MDIQEEYRLRLKSHLDELKWLYMELYRDEAGFDKLCREMEHFSFNRKESLRKLDKERLGNTEWFKSNQLIGMMLYTDAFAGNLKGVREKLPYLESCHVNYIHLMPLLQSPYGRSDGGYAVSDFRSVDTRLGTMADLEQLSSDCHEKGISVCLDFVMNHTSEEHEWAVRARKQEKEYMDRYFFFDSYDIPSQYEKTVPQVFPTTAPGNFTYLPDCNQFVMTTFYPYQWDLNYKNPVVFHEMVSNLLFLANKGIDILRIDAVPYIWKELGTDCRNLPQVHTIVRMMRMIGEIVCPGLILLGEVVMEPHKVTPYFGTVTKPECHLLYNVTTMAATWNTVATKDVRLLKRQMDILGSLPKEYTFLNYLRCHDDIGWGLDYRILSSLGCKEKPHKQFLNDYFTGVFPGSVSRGELYNADPVSGDARFCGTTASMCGVEKANLEQDREAMERAVDLDIMLHAFMLSQSGIPVLYSGDEIGQTNDYDYKKDPSKAEDSRYLHRGALKWQLVRNIQKKGSVQERIFHGLLQLEAIRAREEAFSSTAEMWTLETWDHSILAFARAKGNSKLIALYNFSDSKRVAWINEEDGEYEDLITGEIRKAAGIPLKPYGFLWLKKSLTN